MDCAYFSPIRKATASFHECLDDEGHVRLKNEKINIPVAHISEHQNHNLKMTPYTQQLDPRTGKFLTLHFFTNVENTKEIKQKILSGDLKCCIIKASMIVDPFQVVVAANKAVLRHYSESLITRSVFTEILYCISSSTNISQSLTKFGIHDNDKNILVALIHEANDKVTCEENILKEVKGVEMSITRLKEFADVTCVRKLYKINDEELKVSTLEDSIVSRIGGDYPVSMK